MSIEDDIECSVSTIRSELDNIRSADMSEDALADIEPYLASIENECDTLANLEADDPDDIIGDAMSEMGLGGLLSHWGHIDAGTADELRDTVTRILKEHGYSVG